MCSIRISIVRQETKMLKYQTTLAKLLILKVVESVWISLELIITKNSQTIQVSQHTMLLKMTKQSSKMLAILNSKSETWEPNSTASVQTLVMSEIMRKSNFRRTLIDLTRRWLSKHRLRKLSVRCKADRMMSNVFRSALNFQDKVKSLTTIFQITKLWLLIQYQTLEGQQINQTITSEVSPHKWYILWTPFSRDSIAYAIILLKQTQ